MSKGEEGQLQTWHPIEDIACAGICGPHAPEPKLMLAESPREFVIRVELPEVHRKDVHVNVTESAVTVFARWAKEVRTKDKNGSKRLEGVEKLYSRTLQLPAAVKAEQARASFRDRVLKIFLPRAKPSQVRRIDVE